MVDGFNSFDGLVIDFGHAFLRGKQFKFFFHAWFFFAFMMHISIRITCRHHLVPARCSHGWFPAKRVALRDLETIPVKVNWIFQGQFHVVCPHDVPRVPDPPAIQQETAIKARLEVLMEHVGALILDAAIKMVLDPAIQHVHHGFTEPADR